MQYHNNAKINILQGQPTQEVRFQGISVIPQLSEKTESLAKQNPLWGNDRVVWEETRIIYLPSCQPACRQAGMTNFWKQRGES